jgi:DNA-binding PadR family transcriptional regulator
MCSVGGALKVDLTKYIRYGYNRSRYMSAPLTPAVFHILLALAGGRLHGYAISKEVLRHTDGRVRMGPGTLYGTLQRLLNQGWVGVSESPDEVDERRRYYRLTGLGKRALEAEVQRMDALVRAARATRIKTRTSKA